MKKIRLGILISGRGSNMQALIEACMDSDFPAEVACVISNNKNARGLNIANNLGVKTFTSSGKSVDFNEINSILLDDKVDLVCLAGFMKIVSSDFLKKWSNKVINIHPSLLPSFKGLNAQKQAIEAGVKVSGCTVHYVVPEVDSGPIILQAAVPVFSDDTTESLSKRILKMEHICYAKAVFLIAQNKVKLANGIVYSEEKVDLGLMYTKYHEND